ncbi:MAG: GNAT family N-acetyltransferase, partial [Gemmatimonadetes bacterium]|nr:GNAT family N-acetyltransferase [Gemmatimonadota bacterium]
MSGRGAETLDGRPRGPSAAAGRRLRVRNIGSWDETPVLHPGWNELLASSASRTVFLTREWLQAWWDAYGGARELMLLVCLDDGGSVVGVAPLFRARRRVGPGWSLRIVRLLGDGGGDSDNLDFIAREGCEAEVVRVVVDYLADHASEWDLLELNHVPAESAIAKALEPEVATRGWRGVAREAPRRVIRLSQTWEGHLGKLSKKMRREANHDVRRLEGLHHVGLRRCESEAELPSCLEALFRLDAARWGLRGEAGNFGLPQRRGFYAEVARRFLAAGRLDFWLLDVDGRPAA